MPLADRPGVRRLLEVAQDMTGVTIQSSQNVRQWRVMEQEFQEFQSDAEELALHSLDYFNGRPQEMRPEKRRRLAQRSRIALLQDPLAGAEAQLLADFGFGKGISRPTARDPAVQKVIDSAWTDPINDQTACGYQAQRKLSNELLASAELFPTLYVNAQSGKVRLGRLDADVVIDVVPDPENRQIPLWYVARERKFKWNFALDAPAFTDLVNGSSLAVKYWPHWRNVADALDDRERLGTEDGETELEQPPPDKLAKGLVYPIVINQTGENLRGNPPWARSLRFMNAMNVLTEAHVTMAQAASTFIAKRAMKGTPRQISKAAASVLSSAGELGASAFRQAAGGFGVAGNAEPTTEPFTAPGTPGPFPPGSWWNENDSSALSPLNLQSGSGQMAQTAQIVRAPLAASSGFGQHYLGDTSNANLATASTLELPATMHVGAWQEYFEQFYRWFTDRAIEAAVRAGLLGGGEGFPDSTPLAELHLEEAEDRGEMEKRTGKDLSYEFSMPFPGRRQLADVTTMVQVVSQSQDPNGVNVPLRRILMKFLFEQIGIDDVPRAVDQCIPLDGMKRGIGPQPDAAFGAAGAPPAGGGPAGTGAAHGAAANSPGEGQQPYGAKSGTAAGGGSAGGDGSLEAELPEAARESVERLIVGAGDLMRRVLRDPEVHALVGSTNGSSAGVEH